MEQESQKREVEEAGCQPPPTPNGGGPVLCMNNCGFFGTPATNNFCSKCYKDFYLNQAKAAAASSTTTTVIVVSENKEPPTVQGLDPVGEEGQEDKGIEEGATSGDPGRRGGGSNRCSFCNKRVGLTGFKCRCDLTFCSVHRYSDKHNCLFDYKSAAQDAIAKANPVVKAEKIEKI